MVAHCSNAGFSSVIAQLSVVGACSSELPDYAI